jgi:hypothetical protein
MFAPKVVRSVRATGANYAAQRFAPSGEGSNREAIRQKKKARRYCDGRKIRLLFFALFKSFTACNQHSSDTTTQVSMFLIGDLINVICIE